MARGPYTRLYVHLVWATAERQPLLTPEIRDAVYACIKRDAAHLKAEVIAIGGVADHVHVLARYPAAVSISRLVQQLKGSSSHLVTQRLGHLFQWQGGYGAFSLSRSLIPRVQKYIERQEDHHHDNTLLAALEQDEEEAP